MQYVYGFDVETTGLDPFAPGARVVCASLALWPHPPQKWLTWDQNSGRRATAFAHGVLNTPGIKLVGHNLGFDIAWLPFEPPGDLFDTMIAQYRVDENAPASLEAVASAYLGTGKLPQPESWDALTPELVEYNKQDSLLALRLYPILKNELTMQGLGDLFARDMQLVKLLVRMRKRGVLVDWDRLAATREQIGQEAQEALRHLHELLGRQLSPRSPQQMKQLIYEEYGLPILSRTEKGAPSTGREALALLQAWATPEQREVLSLISKYRLNDKLHSGFAASLPEHKGTDDRLHTTYNLGRGSKRGDDPTGARTGRLSSSGPNLQNLPKRDKRIRQCVVPAPGKAFLRADYSQVELRLAAWMSADPVMRQIFERGEDFHTATLAKLERVSYETAKQAVAESPTWKTKRDACKRVNFGSIYGGYPNTIWKAAISDGFDVQKSLIESIWHEQHRIFAYFWAWAEVVGEMAVRDEKVVSPFGVTRRFPGLTKEEDYATVSYAKRQAVNHLVQNSAAEIMLDGLLDVEAALEGVAAKLLLTIHDEVLIEYDPAAVDSDLLRERVREAMQDRAMLRMQTRRLPDLEHLKLEVETSAPHYAWAG